MDYLKKLSWPFIAILYAVLIYQTNAFNGPVVRGLTPQKYDDLVIKFVSSLQTADFNSASQLFTSETTQEMLETKKPVFEKMFASSDIKKIEPLHLKTGQIQNRDVTQVDYVIYLNNDKKIASLFIFTDENGSAKILNTNFFEGDKVIEHNSFANSLGSTSSVLLIIGFTIAFILIVTAASKVVNDKPKMWGLWLVAILTLGVTSFKGNLISGEWNNQLLHLAFGFPLISYSKNEFTPILLEFCVPVVAILYLAIRKELLVKDKAPKIIPQ